MFSCHSLRGQWAEVLLTTLADPVLHSTYTIQSLLDKTQNSQMVTYNVQAAPLNRQQSDIIQQVILSCIFCSCSAPT